MPCRHSPRPISMFICTRVAEVSETSWKNLSEGSSPRSLPHPCRPMPAWVRVLDEVAVRVLDEVAVRVLDGVAVRVLDGVAVRVLDGVAVRVLDEEVKDNEDMHSHHGRWRHG